MERTSRRYELDTARWYESFLDVCKILHDRSPFLHIAVHPSNEKEFDEARARVREDDLWNFAKRGEPPRILPIDKMSKEEYKAVDVRDLAPQRLSTVLNSATGYGRYGRLYTPREGLRRGD